MEIKTDALVLRSVGIGESDKMLTLLTASYGKIGARIKGVRAKTAKLKFAAQPFCFAEYVLATSGERRTVIGATQYEGFFALRENIESYYAACIVAEACDKLFLEGMQGGETLVAAVTALKTLELSTQSKTRSYVIIKFLLDALKIAGYPVRADVCPVCGGVPHGRMCFSMESGAFGCDGCINGVPASENTYLAIKSVLRGGAPAKEDGIKRALRLLSAYCEFHSEVSLKSLTEYMRMAYSV